MGKQRKIKTDKQGWLVGVYCEQNHAGNNRLSRDGAEHYICAGCGTYYHWTEVMAALRDGQNAQATLGA